MPVCKSQQAMPGREALFTWVAGRCKRQAAQYVCLRPEKVTRAVLLFLHDATGVLAPSVDQTY